MPDQMLEDVERSIGGAANALQHLWHAADFGAVGDLKRGELGLQASLLFECAHPCIRYVQTRLLVLLELKRE